MTNASHYTLTLWIPQQLAWKETEGRTPQTFDRESFLGFLWERFGAERVGENALQGIHEGTMLSDEAFEQGFETEAYTIDSGEAPRERDWIGSQEMTKADLYFGNREAALEARSVLQTSAPALKVGEVEEQKPQDWDAEWKRSFQGVSVPPNWEIRPPWVEAKDLPAGKKLLRLNPGAGFGTGTHETTQCCLELLSGWHQVRPSSEWNFLDFGSGSGILAVGAALLQGCGEGVEIDELAIDNARENADLNGVSDRIEWRKTLQPATRKFDLIFANILKPVLLQFASELVARVKPGGALILSGLVEDDVTAILPIYEPLFGKPATKVLAKNEWRAVLFTEFPTGRSPSL